MASRHFSKQVISKLAIAEFREKFLRILRDDELRFDVRDQKVVELFELGEEVIEALTRLEFPGVAAVVDLMGESRTHHSEIELIADALGEWQVAVRSVVAASLLAKSNAELPIALAGRDLARPGLERREVAVVRGAS